MSKLFLWFVLITHMVGKPVAEKYVNRNERRDFKGISKK